MGKILLKGGTVLSVDASSTTITSKSVNVWAKTDPRHSPIVSAALYAGIMTETAVTSLRPLIPTEEDHH